MAQNSKIEWLARQRPDGTYSQGHTGNLWWGCTKVHEGCDNCYAETLSNRTGADVWGKDKPRKATKAIWSEFEKWQNIAADAGTVDAVFVGSMMDIFEKSNQLIDWQGNRIEGKETGMLRYRFFKEIVPACPNLQFLCLTKRPSNINRMIPDEWKNNPPKNVMFGTSPVNPETFKNLVRQLQEVNGYRFLSVEPQLALIEPTDEQLSAIDWVIQGGESGGNRRPFSLDWIAPLRDACQRNKVPYFFKQIDRVTPVPEWAMVRELPSVYTYKNIQQ